IPANLHFRTPNPHIPFGELPICVADRLTAWPDADGPALAGVSALGFGGTNAHIVLEEAPAAVQLTSSEAADRPVVVPVSARTPEALRARALGPREWLASPPASDLRDIAWTAGVRRDHHNHRLAIVASSVAEATSLLDAHGRGEAHSNVISGRKSHDR